VNISVKSDDLNHIYPERAEFMYGDAVEIKIKHSRTLSELKVRVLRIEDLIATKITAGRDKDYVDVQNLIESVKISGRALDWPRIKENVKSTKTRDTRIRAIKYVRDLEREFCNKPTMILK
ncbi:MAG: nucleotidyltransferase, partial [Candidatus Anstonellales archaeon]